MNLPVTKEYLVKAVTDGAEGGDTVLTHHKVADLQLPSGKLVACDPFVFPDTNPFDLLLPKGVFPVIASIASFGKGESVAFATVRFRETSPVAWDLLVPDEQDRPTLKADELYGYPVDAATGCFMDQRASRILDQTMKNDPDFYQVLIAEFEKNSKRKWDSLEYKLGNGEQNLVAFTSGFGDGVYASYAGFDADSEVSVVVTDFRIVREKK